MCALNLGAKEQSTYNTSFNCRSDVPITLRLPELLCPVPLPPQAGSDSGQRSTCHLQRPCWMQGTERVSRAQAGSLHHIVVRAAEEPIFPQRKLVPGDELAAAGHAAETLDVVHLGAGAHHEVVLTEADAALGAFDSVQPAEGAGRGQKRSTRRRGHLRQVLPWPKIVSGPSCQPLRCPEKSVLSNRSEETGG